nr:DoxX family protein [Methylobacterium sp. OTU13CASTA1]
MAAYGFIGIVHLAAPDAFLPIMPDWVPAPRRVVILTGLCELAGVAGLIWPPTRRWAGIGLALYAVCVFPANIKHAVEGIPVAGLPDSWWYHGPRLAFQPVFVWWALYATHVIDWPRRTR